MRYLLTVSIIVTPLFAADQADTSHKKTIDKLVYAGKNRAFGSRAAEQPTPHIDAKAYKSFEDLEKKNPEKFKQLVTFVNSQAEKKPQVPYKNSSSPQQKKN